jgi:hypothetical protein
MKNKSGQITIISILISVVLLIVYVSFLPVIYTVINSSAPYLTDTPMTYALVGLFPLFLIIAIIISVFSSTQRDQYMQ